MFYSKEKFSNAFFFHISCVNNMFDIAAGRLWSFQICTEFGNFQVAPKFDAIRSPKIDLRYYHWILYYDITLTCID